ncbi:hypothetical protein DPMN_071438 [Dreissena polymorpha]|uniref:Uncharacterized protein n=1 Tax=Dreissena polymorpha TaxID=45954 RepID=A0A9D3Z7Q3_DREPO|nr:hypothetical protein DPMN_071438 [Dreissena polymorpha]
MDWLFKGAAALTMAAWRGRRDSSSGDSSSGDSSSGDSSSGDSSSGDSSSGDSSSDDDFEACVQPKHVEEQTRDILSRPYYRPEKAVEEQKRELNTTENKFRDKVRKQKDAMSAPLKRNVLPTERWRRTRDSLANEELDAAPATSEDQSTQIQDLEGDNANFWKPQTNRNELPTERWRRTRYSSANEELDAPPATSEDQSTQIKDWKIDYAKYRKPQTNRNVLPTERWVCICGDYVMQPLPCNTYAPIILSICICCLK